MLAPVGPELPRRLIEYSEVGLHRVAGELGVPDCQKVVAHGRVRVRGTPRAQNAWK